MKQMVSISKEKLQAEIDHLPEQDIEQVYWFVCSIRPKKPVQSHIPSFHLKGQFDHLSIRELAYE
jgi:hypothetical protein